MNLRAVFALTVAAAFFGGCVAVRPSNDAIPGGSPRRGHVEPGFYIVMEGHDAAEVAELRAAPAPQLPEVTTGAAVRADERKLVSRSYVRIGTGCFPSSDEAANDWAMRTGIKVGAEKVLLYSKPAPPAPIEAFDTEMRAACITGADPDPRVDFVATFYVRYKLPFGAQFRNMSDSQMKALGVDGGVQVGEVIAGTPAADANLRNGDFVIRFNGAPIRNRAAFQDLLRSNMGRRVTLTVSRDGALFDRLVRLGVLATESHATKK